MTTAKPKPMPWTFYRACRFLAAKGPQPADLVGNVVWQGKQRGKTTSMGGGGDYAAQMLLGRMKKAGLVRHANSPGSTTQWEVTALGRREMKRLEGHKPTDVTCPTCSAWEGWACEGDDYGYHAAGYHPARHAAAEAETRKDPS